MIEHSQTRLIHELATLVEAGLSPNQARELLREPLESFDGLAAKQLQLNWHLAADLGAPVVDTLRQLAANLENLAAQGRAQRLAYSTPKLTARLIAWLPVASLSLAQLLGLNPLGAIVSNFAALVSVLLGLGLMASAHNWTKKMIQKAKPSDDDAGQFVDAVAVAMLAGLPISAALVEARQRYVSVFEREPPTEVLNQINQTAEFTNRTGAASVTILRALATDLRRDHQQLASEKIEQLSIRLLLPIGLLVLPAFGLLTVVPIAFGFLSSAT